MNDKLEEDKKLYIILGILLIIIFVILRNLIVSNNEKIIDYNKINTGADVIYTGTRVKDREVYYTIEQILSKFILAYSNEVNKLGMDTSSYKDYYNVLESGYMRTLSRGKYYETAQNFFTHFEVDNSVNSIYTTEYATENIIRNIYLLKDNCYLCMVGQEYGESYGYFGVCVYENNTYSIFYLE